jgi:hypothetical protein
MFELLVYLRHAVVDGIPNFGRASAFQEQIAGRAMSVCEIRAFNENGGKPWLP